MPFDPGLYLSFIAIATIAIISPGPDTLLILRYTLGSGFRMGLAATLGVQLGLALHGIFAVLGLSIIIKNIPITLQIISILGALYLLLLAIQQLREVSSKTNLNALAHSKEEVNYQHAITTAVLTNLLNPKVILLFIALMPSFIAQERGPVFAQFAIFAITMVFINSVFQITIVFLANKARKFLTQHIVQKLISILTASIFIAFAILIILDHVMNPSI